MLVQSICSDKHKTIWRSQPLVHRYSKGNLRLAAAVLFSANTFQKISKYFEITNIQWITKTSYYSIQVKILTCFVNKNYSKINASITHRLIEQRPCKLSGDGRCDSPGWNAKYLTYSLMNQETNEIIAFSINPVTEAGNSNHMEKLGFQKMLNKVRGKGIVVNQLTTDRDMQIWKYMKEDEPQINHQFDVWYFSKSIKSKLIAVDKKSFCAALQKWSKSIINLFLWACATSQDNEQLLREKWVRVLFHVQNKHSWTTGDLFSKCEHPELTKKQIKSEEWFSPNSDAFMVLQDIVHRKPCIK